MTLGDELMRVSAWFLLIAAGVAHADEPRPLIWPAGPLEVRMAPATAISPAAIDSFAGRLILFGKESDAPRPNLRISAARLTDDGQTLILLTDPHPRACDVLP